MARDVHVNLDTNLYSFPSSFIWIEKHVFYATSQMNKRNKVFGCWEKWWMWPNIRFQSWTRMEIFVSIRTTSAHCCRCGLHYYSYFYFKVLFAVYFQQVEEEVYDILQQQILSPHLSLTLCHNIQWDVQGEWFIEVVERGFETVYFLYCIFLLCIYRRGHRKRMVSSQSQTRMFRNGSSLTQSIKHCSEFVL